MVLAGVSRSGRSRVWGHRLRQVVRAWSAAPLVEDSNGELDREIGADAGASAGT